MLNQQYTFSTFLSNNKNSSNPTFFINPGVKGIDSYTVNSFTGINNIYTFDNRNCNLLIQETGESPFPVVIPTGNYTISSLLTTLSSILTTASTTSVYTATKNDLTNLITITSDTKTFSLIDTVNNCYYEIGFLKLNSSSLSQVASSQYDLSGIKTIHIVSNDLGNDGSFLINTNYNVLCSIPVNVPYLGVIGYEKTSDLLVNCKVNELNSITFTLLDERFRILSNVSDWSLQIITNLN